MSAHAICIECGLVECVCPAGPTHQAPAAVCTRCHRAACTCHNDVEQSAKPQARIMADDIRYNPGPDGWFRFEAWVKPLDKRTTLPETLRMLADAVEHLARGERGR